MSEPVDLRAPFPDIHFSGTLRPSQQAVADIARKQLDEGRRKLHIVAPPGSGKTVLGLYLWAELIRQPALVLSPNSAIQAQWKARTDLFGRVDQTPIQNSVSTSRQETKLLNSLTYQSVTMPARATEHLDARAIDLWIQTLLEKEQAESASEAEIWVQDLRIHNPNYFDDRVAHYRKRVRDDDALDGRAMSLLHESCLDALIRLRDRGIGLLILDECHHLMGHWGRVLAEISEYLGDPVVVGLTATPPERSGRKPEDIDRYDDFFGEIDFQVPLPAVVKDGFLAPYQDLAYFVRPNKEELAFIAKVDQQFGDLIEQLCEPREHGDQDDPTIEVNESQPLPRVPRESLIDWLSRVLRDKQLPAARMTDWRRFHARDSDFAEAAVLFLKSRGIAVPHDIPELPPPEADDESILVTLLDRYTRHCLRRSPHPEDHRLAEDTIDRLRMLGVQITDTGHRPCASPISRVIAYTRSKTEAVVPILKREMEVLGNSTRAVVIADFEKSSVITPEIAHLLDEEAGGAIAAFRALLDDKNTNQLDPILLTGSTVLVDADLIDRFLNEANLWLKANSRTVELSKRQEGTFCVIRGRGGDWCPRVYVELITELFQRGVTRCLVGTRGLLGEGWDANRINVLVDLSTATTSMTVNQVRGRSIRLDPTDQYKLANNWDIVCIAPEFTKGLDDYRRFIGKHRTLYGICDDGVIEKGVGHVHAAFTEIRPELLEENVPALNEDMLARAALREQVYRQWKIGETYSPEPIRAVEVAARSQLTDRGFPPFKRSAETWNGNSLVTAIGNAILAALVETKQISTTTDGQPTRLRASNRAGGYVRVFLQNANDEDANAFVVAMREALGPLESPRYVIPRFVDVPTESLINRLLPSPVRRFFERRERRMVMLHAVPSRLATKRDLVDVYQTHWNHFVSPGDAVYSKNDAGQRVISNAVNAKQLPQTVVHDKEMFL